MSTTTKKKAAARHDTGRKRMAAVATEVLVVSYNPRMVKTEAIAEKVQEMHGVNAVDAPASDK